MPKLYRYKKITDEYTTHTVQGEGITEICEIDGDTIIAVPDDVVLPKQPKQITLQDITNKITAEQKKAIRKASPHIQLIISRVIEKIRERYDISDEIELLRRKITNDTTVTSELTEYNAYIQECVAWGKAEKAKLGL